MPELHGSVRVQEFPEPQAARGARIISVTAGGIGPTDLLRAVGRYKTVAPPYVVGGEGVGRLEDGTRVYFGHSISPYGSWAQKTIVAEEEIWPIPDEVPDELAIVCGISGTGALIPLEQARIRAGDRVLVLGATGPLGQIGLQLARLMGAGKVVAAARGLQALERLRACGVADEIVQLGAGDDHAALAAVAGEGYDAVLDVVFGPPAQAAIRACAAGARIVSVGTQAGDTVTLGIRDIIHRWHCAVATGTRPVAERRAAFERLLALARNGAIKVDVTTFSLGQAMQAWQAQGRSAHSKIILRIDG
jgi:NADPH:quinone reductase-like Zn-dependent oxidoreductase